MASSTNNEKIEKERPTTMYEGKNIHSSPVDGKLLCSFSEKTCMQRRLNHYAFCIRHVLEDKNSPFKQCKFVAKYNGQRCTNAIPVKEARIYCNSHLQVLGLVPKKSRKKKAGEQRVNTAKNIAKSSTTEILLSNCCASQNLISKRSEKAIGCSETPEQRVSRKDKLLSSNPLLSKLVNTYSQANSQKRNLLPFYGLCSSDEDESSNDDDTQEKKKQLKKCITKSEVESTTSMHLAVVKDNSRSAKLQRLRETLRGELLNVNKAINTHHKDVKQSDQALQLLVAAAKSSPALTTAAIHNEKNYLLGSRKRTASATQDFIPCTAETPEKIKCDRRSIPYTKYCFLHILKDGKQQLFHQCAADISPTVKCSRNTLDILSEKPLCREHSLPKDVPVHPVAQHVQPIVPPLQLPVQKPPAKKARKKPQVKTPAQKAAKTNRRTTKKESNKTSKSDKTKKGGAQQMPVKVKQEPVLNRAVNHINYEKSLYPTESMEREQHQHSSIYPLNGTLKLDQLPPNKNDMFDDDSFKEQGMFDESEVDVDDSLENDDLSEDLGDISPTGLLRETVLKLPPESPDPTGSSHAQHRVSPVEAFSMNSINEGNLHKSIVTGNRMELPRKDGLGANDISSRVIHNNVIPGLRPSRTTVITLPKYPSNTTSHNAPSIRQIPPGINTDYNSFKPIGPAIVKSEVGGKKADPRPIDINHGLQLFPLPFDPVMNSSVAWGGGKFLLNNRARPLLLSSQMNPVTFSPPSLSPHVSPQITMGTAFNFDRPTVLQHSNSPSPTLSPFSAHLPNSPHGKLVPRTLRLESRGSSSSNDIHDPFFGASSFDKP